MKIKVVADPTSIQQEIQKMTENDAEFRVEAKLNARSIASITLPRITNLFLKNVRVIERERILEQIQREIFETMGLLDAERSLPVERFMNRGEKKYGLTSRGMHGRSYDRDFGNQDRISPRDWGNRERSTRSSSRFTSFGDNHDDHKISKPSTLKDDNKNIWSFFERSLEDSNLEKEERQSKFRDSRKSRSFDSDQ